MPSAVKSLSFASRWTDIPVWGIVNLKTSQGDIRAEYLNASERQSGSAWQYDFLIHEDDLPGTLTLDDVENDLLISPFVEAFAPCTPVRTRCFDDLPFVEADEYDEIIVPVFNEECGVWCIGRAARPPQYEPGGEFYYTPPE